VCFFLSNSHQFSSNHPEKFLHTAIRSECGDQSENTRAALCI